jgi:hypothetical protein
MGSRFIYIVSSSDGIPVEILFLPGSSNDSMALYELPFELPEGSEIYTDSAYTNYVIEDELYENSGIKLSPQRKSNSKRRKWDLTQWYSNYLYEKENRDGVFSNH